MKIGIISNSDVCLPLLYALKNDKALVGLYLGATAGNDEASITALCKHYQVPVTTETTDNHLLYSWVHAWQPDIIFLIGYNRRIDVLHLRGVQHGVYNIHFGTLPFFRGANPVFWQLKKGVQQLGLTIHVVTAKMDSGPVVWQQTFANEPHCTYSYVHYFFSNVLRDGVYAILKNILAGMPLQPVEQDAAAAKWYPRPVLQDVLINWQQMEAREIVSLVKACTCWNQGAITTCKGYEMKIIDATCSNNTRPLQDPVPAGTITCMGNEITVYCKDDAWLHVHLLKMNHVHIPARFAGKWGLVKGLQLGE